MTKDGEWYAARISGAYLAKSNDVNDELGMTGNWVEAWTHIDELRERVAELEEEKALNGKVMAEKLSQILSSQEAMMESFLFQQKLIRSLIPSRDSETA